jgi:hydroxyethylthiazole kinase-like uncharacterized protein yjeF
MSMKEPRPSGYPLRKPVSSEEMKLLEERGQRIGISKLLMMENAGSAIATFAHDLISGSTIGSKMKRVVLVGGTGNNGGDVFVASRHLAYWGNLEVIVLLIGQSVDIRTDEAKTNWDILSQIPNVRLVVIDEVAKIGLIERNVREAAIIVVGIFGTGFKGVPRELQLNAIARLNSIDGPLKISVDIPSGMEADSGSHEYAIHSNYTITMHAPKLGMFAAGADRATGEIVQANIGLPF